MATEEDYRDFYGCLKETYDLLRSGETSFIPFKELEEHVGVIIRTYEYLVPKEVRDSFEIKPSDLEGLLESRAFIEATVSKTLVRVRERTQQIVQ